MKIIAEYSFKVPEFILSALVNGDMSGLTDDDEKVYQEAIGVFNNITGKEHGTDYIISVPDEAEPYFSDSPDFGGLACNVITCNILIV